MMYVKLLCNIENCEKRYTNLIEELPSFYSFQNELLR